MVQRTALEQMGTLFAVVHDPRRQQPTTRHTLETILPSTMLATRCGAPHGVEIAPWGQATGEGRAECLDRPHGIPSHDTSGRVFAVLDPASLQQACGRWMKALADLRHDLVARAGKTLRRSLDRAEGNGPMHVVPAWASAKALGLAQCSATIATRCGCAWLGGASTRFSPHGVTTRGRRIKTAGNGGGSAGGGWSNARARGVDIAAVWWCAMSG